MHKQPFHVARVSTVLLGLGVYGLYVFLGIFARLIERIGDVRRFRGQRTNRRVEVDGLPSTYEPREMALCTNRVQTVVQTVPRYGGKHTNR